MQLKNGVFEKPATMKAAQVKDYGSNFDELVTVEDGVAYPSLSDFGKGWMVIETHAVALACGDVRVMSGLTKEIQGPPSFPYIPCGDASGVVVELPLNATDDFPFKVGDRVTARFKMFPRDVLAEYAVIHPAVCEKVPEKMSSVDAAALAGAAPATLLGERIKAGERVLILGAGGGVGAHACQVMRARGASYIVGASTQSPERLLKAPTSYDKIINYEEQDPFTFGEFQKDPFDVVVDLSGAGAWLSMVKNAKEGIAPIVKPANQGGRYLTLTTDKAIFEAHSMLATMTPFLWIPLWRAIKSRLWRRRKLPKYTFAMSLDEERSHLTRTLDMATKGTVSAVVDPRGPFPFTTEGVRQAFHTQETRHGQGKIVVQVKKET